MTSHFHANPSVDLMVLWKQFITSGTFDDNYPQRVNSSFSYLSCDNDDLKSFTLKDLVKKGNDIFPYLSLEIDQDNTLATMDLFRIFDKTGKGSVVLEEFILGIIEKKVELLKQHAHILQTISEQLINLESRCSELANLLEKGSNSSTNTLNSNQNTTSKPTAKLLTLYNVHLKALNYLICPQIRAYKSQQPQQQLSSLTSSILLTIFQRCVGQVIYDLLQYFHIPTNRLITNLGNKLDGLDIYEMLNKDNQLMLWNISPSSSYTILDNDLLPSSDTTALDSALIMLNTNNTNNSLNHSHPEDVLSQLLSQLDDSNTFSHRLSSTSTSYNNNNINNTNNHSQAYNQSDLRSLLQGIHLNISIHDIEKIFGQLGISSDHIKDSSQLHMLQEAFLALDYFFQLRVTDPSASSGHDTTNNSNLTEANDENNSYEGNSETVNSTNDSNLLTSDITNKQTIKSHHKPHRRHHKHRQELAMKSNAIGASTSALTHLNLPKRLQEYKELIDHHLMTLSLSSSNNSNNNNNTNNNSSTNPTNASSNTNNNTNNNNLTNSNSTNNSNPLNSSNNLTNVTNNNPSSTNTTNNTNNNLNSSVANNNNNAASTLTPSTNNLIGSNLLEYLLAEELFTTQEHLTRTQTRLNVLEIIQSQAISSSTSTSNTSNKSTKPTNETLPSKPIQFQDILSEIHDIEGHISQRSSMEYPLGYYLQENQVCTLIPPKISLLQSFEENINSTSTPLTPSNPELKQLEEELKQLYDKNLLKESILYDLQTKDLQLLSLQTTKEQIEIQKNENITLQVELQLLKDKQKHVLSHIYQEKLSELNQTIANLKQENTLLLQRLDGMPSTQQTSLNNNNMMNGSMAESKVPMTPSSSSSAQNNVNKSNKSSTNSPTNTNNNNNNNPTSSTSSSKASRKLLEYEQQIEQFQQEKQSFQQQIHQLTMINKNNENRIQSILQDQQHLYTQMQQYEEQIYSLTAANQSLSYEKQETSELKIKYQQDQLKLQSYQQEIHQVTHMLHEQEEQLKKYYKQEESIVYYELQLNNLEMKLLELENEKEKLSLQVMNYQQYYQSAQIKAQENQELQLQLYQKEQEIQELQLISTKYNNLLQELSEYKLKNEKLPTLMGEISRLKGQNRALMQCISELDPMILQLKQKNNQFEKEIMILRNENTILQEIEKKYKKIQEEMKSMASMQQEMNKMKSTMKNVEDEKKTMDNQFKKMRKFMRQSVLLNTTVSSMASSNNTSSAAAEPTSPTPNNTNNTNTTPFVPST